MLPSIKTGIWYKGIGYIGIGFCPHTLYKGKIKYTG